MKKEFRKRKLTLRKNFFPTLIIIVVLWTLLVMVIYFVDPDAMGSIPLFFILFFLALLFTLSTLFANTRRGLIAALGFSVFLVLQYLGVGSVINFLLLIGLGVAAEFYFSKK